MKRIENNCVSCEHCLNCGAKHQNALYCDICGEVITDDNSEEFDGKDVCFDCQYKAHELKLEHGIEYSEALEMLEK